MKGRACQALSSYILPILSISFSFMEMIVNIVLGQIYCSEMIFIVFTHNFGIMIDKQ